MTGNKRGFISRIREVVWLAVLPAVLMAVMTGCGGKRQENSGKQEGKAGTASVLRPGTGIAGETAEDAQVDFKVLKEENPDIFAWLYIPDTAVDVPVLQNTEEDDFYKDHNAYGEEDSAGAAYIELANLSDMCDFNTVIHCGGAGKTGAFADLYRFAEPDFFEEHEQMYLYLDGNVLTYEIFAAYERENTSLLRSYDFTYLTGCQAFLNDMYGIRDLSMNLREGWEGVSPYHFLVTLTLQETEDADKQFVILAILIQDAAGTVDRIVTE